MTHLLPLLVVEAFIGINAGIIVALSRRRDSRAFRARINAYGKDAV
jgi:hypothetical protein